MKLDSLVDQMSGVSKDKKEKYIQANQMLDGACKEIRDISHNLGSTILRKVGLMPELEALVNEIENLHNIQVEFVSHGYNGNLSNDVELKIYRIIQELIGNVLKHANASKLTLQLNQFDEGEEQIRLINLMVEDNGNGFDPSQVSNGMGLQNISARVNDLSGEITIDSEIGRGTNISIDIPIDTTSYVSDMT